MRTLVAKELRALAPIGVLAMLVMSGDLFYRPLIERHDEATWLHIADYVEPGHGGSLAFVLLVLSTVVAFAAYPREHDERTIDLLHSLPIRKSTIFLAKVSAGLTVLFASVLALFLTDALQSTLSPESLAGHQWRLELALGFAALQAVYCVIAYGHALFASVLRLFGLIPYVILLVVMATLEDHVPPLAWVDPGEILVARYHGSSLVVPWTAMAAHLAVAACAYGAAYLAWAGPAERIGRAFERLRASVAGKIAFGCAGAMVIGLLALIAFALLVGGMPDDPEDDSDDGSFEVAERRTGRYLFTYPVSLRARAEPLIRAADGMHEELRVRLGAQIGRELVADLSDTSGEHLGIAAWTHVRVGIVAERDPVRLRRTFAHESAHAFQYALTDGRQDAAQRFFAEGSAEHLAYLLVPDDAALARARVVAVASWRRHRMRFEDLADDTRLRARFDPMLVYVLGELWTAALVEAHGDAAIGEVLRAIGRGEGPRDLEPRAFWEDALRRAGYDLETVGAAFERSVAQIAAREGRAIEALPRIGGGVVEGGGANVRIAAVLDRDPPRGAACWVRIRARPDAGDTETFALRGQIDAASPRRVVFEVHRAFLPSERFQLLFSIAADAQSWAFSETWQWASAR